MSESSGKHICECSRDCNETFEADSIGELAQQVSQHFNHEHSQSLQHNYQVFDSEEVGGHHIRENVYQIRRLERRVTAYDILAVGRGQPLDESFAVPSDPRCCIDCWKFTRTADVDAIELESSGVWGCKARCENCQVEHEEGTKKQDSKSEEQPSKTLSDFGTTD